MGTFLTEKEIEASLHSEMRLIPMPDNSQHPCRAFSVVWKNLDYMMKAYDFTLEWFVELGITHAEETNRSFDDGFSDMVHYVRHRCVDIHER